MMFTGATIICASGGYIVIQDAGGSLSKNRPVLNNLNRGPEMGGMPKLSIITSKAWSDVTGQTPTRRD